MKSIKKRLSYLLCLLLCVLLSTSFSGCALSKILEYRQSSKPQNDPKGDFKKIIKKELNEEELDYIDLVAEAICFYEYSSSDSLNDQKCFEMVGAILNAQHTQNNNYAVTPQIVDDRFVLAKDVCHEMVDCLFGYKMNGTLVQNGNYIFEKSVNPSVEFSGRDISLLEDGTFSLVYTFETTELQDEKSVVVTHSVSIGVVRFEMGYGSFRFLNVLSTQD